MYESEREREEREEGRRERRAAAASRRGSISVPRVAFPGRGRREERENREK